MQAEAQARWLRLYEAECQRMIEAAKKKHEDALTFERVTVSRSGKWTRISRSLVISQAKRRWGQVMRAVPKPMC